MWAVALPPICFWHAKKDIIYAWIVHRWIVNRWIVYRELAQPLILTDFHYTQLCSEKFLFGIIFLNKKTWFVTSFMIMQS